MRTYEMTIIYRVGDEDYTKGKQLVSELLEKHQVEVVKTSDLSIRFLAYPIKREEKGHYIYHEIKADPEVITQLERALKMMIPVLKSLIVRKETEEAAPATKEAPAPTPVEPKQEAPAEAPEEPKQEAPVEESAEPTQEAPAEAPEEPKQETPAEEPEAVQEEAPQEEPVEEAPVEDVPKKEQEPSA